MASSAFGQLRPKVLPPRGKIAVPRGGANRMATILVVDDEPAVLTLWQRMLQSGGYGVVTASSGEAALSAACNDQHSIDLALLDVMMPGMNGVELNTTS